MNTSGSTMNLYLKKDQRYSINNINRLVINKSLKIN